MAVDLETIPDFDVLIEMLLVKTRSGKLDWQPTAGEDTYVAAVKGQRTFEISKEERLQNVMMGAGVASRHPMCTMKVRGPDGELLIETTPSNLSDQLFEVARRLALRVDENIDSTVQLLETL